MNIPEEQCVPCKYCGVATHMVGTKLCDRCWELESRIRWDPDIAAQIFSILAPAPQESEPDLYQIRMVAGRSKGNWVDSNKAQYDKLNGNGWEGRKLYTRPGSNK